MWDGAGVVPCSPFTALAVQRNFWLQHFFHPAGTASNKNTVHNTEGVFVACTMELKGVRLFACILILAHISLQQTPAKKKPLKKDVSNSAAIEELQKQIDDIVQELNLLKEQQALQTVCLKGTKIHGKCFLADSEKKHFHAATEDCIAKGGTLSVPVSQEENEQLYMYVQASLGSEEQIWLGINGMAIEGQWTDQTGSVVRYKNWHSKDTPKPDGIRTQKCVVLSPTASGKWFDENCRDKKASVCEFNIV
ncbi:tetranectin-like [Arapaima gigas]